ncbi:MAG: SRPBCC family protein [Myxococcota bacterium]
MATVVKVAELTTSADKVWEIVSDVGNVPALTGMVEESRMDGTTRLCTLAGGGELRETILSVDSEARRLAYRIHESPFPIEEHAASIVVEALDEGCRVTWTTDLLPDSAVPAFREAADAMFADMTRRLG